MELKHRLDLRKVLAVVYGVVFAVYLVIGLQPAAAYDVAARVEIPSTGISSDVTELTLENHQLNVPDEIVGSYSQNNNKTLLIGHSGGVFADLHEVTIGDTIIYGGKEYTVTATEIKPKSAISMNILLAPADVDTLVIMTCAGDSLPDRDATHRLIVTAETS